MRYVLSPEDERRAFLKSLAAAINADVNDRGFFAKVERKSKLNNLSRPLNGKGPLPPKLVNYIFELKLGKELKRFEEVARSNRGATTRAFAEGRLAFEALALEATSLPKITVRLVVFSCLYSSDLIGDLLAKGAEVTVLVSDPLAWKKSGTRSKVNDTMTIFRQADRLASRVAEKGRLAVHVYGSHQPPFRGMLVDDCGLAIGPYRRDGSGKNKDHSVWGYHLPAVVIGRDDSAYVSWQKYFMGQFSQLMGEEKPKLVIENAGVKFHSREIESLVDTSIR